MRTGFFLHSEEIVPEVLEVVVDEPVEVGESQQVYPVGDDVLNLRVTKQPICLHSDSEVAFSNAEVLYPVRDLANRISLFSNSTTFESLRPTDNNEKFDSEKYGSRSRNYYWVWRPDR